MSSQPLENSRVSKLQRYSGELRAMRMEYNNQAMRNFKRLKIWQKGVEIVVKVYALSSTLRDTENYGIRVQINKSSTGITSNIAEGNAQIHHKDYTKYLRQALACAFELETQLMTASALRSADPDRLVELLEDLDQEQRMLRGFIDSLAGQ
jgi:four helix bundle protein